MWQLLLLLFIIGEDRANQIEYTFHKPKILFNHLAVDGKSGAVYVGAVNRIFQLSPNLQVAQKVITGPLYDSQLCSFDCTDKVKVLTDNFNKVLVIDYAHNRLITCGSTLQGMCSTRLLTNIYVSRDVPKAVAANDPTAITVAFIAPGPPDPNTTQVMYTGVTFTGSLAHRYHVPAVSSLSLEDHRLFDVAKVFCEFCHSDQVTGTRLFINTMYRDQYIVNYVYGFSSGTFSYFLTTHRNTDGSYQSKIIRICHNDEQYHSYTEIPISCKQNQRNMLVSHVEAGFVAKPGKNLAKSLGISEEQDVLYTIFNSQEINGNSTANMSALCIYTIQDINEKIGASIEDCFKGEGMRGLPHVLPNRKCVKHNLKSNGSEFCGTDVNTPLGCELPIERCPVAEFNETLTAIAAVSLENYTVVFAGTTQGHLKKVVLESATTAREYGDIVVDKGSPVNKDLIFDTQKTYLYVMTKHRVSKVRVHQCSEYKSCTTCVRASDPFCGWCVVENKCSIQSECQNAREDPLFWLPYNVTQCILIAQVTPVHIPQHSKNVVATFADPLPAPNSFNHLALDHNSGNVYIGAVNRIFQLSPELDVAQLVFTGASRGSDTCFPNCSLEYPTKPIQNYNKVLLIDYAKNRLIHCGSALRGICSSRDLYDFSYNENHIFDEPVANELNASMVAFIAPGPPDSSTTEVMYVGVTYSFTYDVFIYPHPPAVSSRSLENHNLFKIVNSESGFHAGTQMTIKINYRDSYRINYVYGFSSEGFSYFLTTQPSKFTSSIHYSHIVRLCHNDSSYNSYIEIPMFCVSENNSSPNYNLVQAAFVGKPGSVLAEDLGVTVNDDVLFAVFNPSELNSSSLTSHSSALCVYSLKKIRHAISLNIMTCYKGVGLQGRGSLPSTERCMAKKLESLNEDFCGSKVNAPIAGEHPITTYSMAEFPAKLTAVTAAVTGENTVVFAGTVQGHLKKILVQNATSAVEYDDIVVDEGSSVNKDLVFDTQQMHLYVMTESKVTKVKVHQCAEHKKCFLCVAAKDPYCEWCEAERKCGPRAQCKTFDVNNTNCSHGIQKTTVGRTAKAPLQLVVENMPIDNVELFCVFTLPTVTLTVNAIRKEYGVDCRTPDPDQLPRAPVGLHEYTAKLSLTTANRSELAATKIIFFTCSSYISCIECTNSSYGCHWDLADSMCIDKIDQNDSTIVANKVLTENDRQLRPVCPSLVAPERTWLPAGVKVSVKVKVRGIRHHMAEKLYCTFKLEARTTIVKGKFHNEVVSCDDAMLDYKSRAPVMSASLTVAWDEWKRLDNPLGVHLKVYKCAIMASDERSCNLLQDIYMCRWNEKGICEYQTRENYSDGLTDFDSSEQ